MTYVAQAVELRDVHGVLIEVGDRVLVLEGNSFVKKGASGIVIRLDPSDNTVKIKFDEGVYGHFYDTIWLHITRVEVLSKDDGDLFNPKEKPQEVDSVIRYFAEHPVFRGDWTSDRVIVNSQFWF